MTAVGLVPAKDAFIWIECLGKNAGKVISAATWPIPKYLRLTQGIRCDTTNSLILEVSKGRKM